MGRRRRGGSPDGTLVNVSFEEALEEARVRFLRGGAGSPPDIRVAGVNGGSRVVG